jgi:hypothetical protein
MNTSEESYTPRYDFLTMMTYCTIWGILGIVFGIIINNTVTIMCNTFKITVLFVKIVTQLILCVFFLTLVQYLFNYFGWSWQNTTPGLFFISFFFGIQFDIFSNIQRKYMYYLK